MSARAVSSRFAGFRLLASAYDYRPRLGGIATLSFELLRSMREDWGVDVRVVAPDLPGSREFDATSPVPAVRLSLPSRPIAASPWLAGRMAGESALGRVDAVLNLLWMPDGMASWMARPALGTRGTPYYVYAHGLELMESRWNLKKRLRAGFSPIKHSVFRGAAGIFANSRFTRDLVERECSPARERLHVAYPGVDPSRFGPGAAPADLIEQYGLAGRRVLVTTSRLNDYKGMDRVIASLRWVVGEFPDVTYLICGEGPDRARLESIIRHYRMEKHVVFGGRVAGERLADHYRLGEVFVMASRMATEPPNVEGFGLVYLEAAACAKPSIGGQDGGVPEAIGGSDYGWLVDPTDDRAIAEAIREALRDPEATRRRGTAAFDRALQEFSWRRMAEGMLEIMTGEGARDVRD